MGREGHHDLPTHPFRLRCLAASGAQPHLDLRLGGGGGLDCVRWRVDRFGRIDQVPGGRSFFGFVAEERDRVEEGHAGHCGAAV
jgi:hypothetical protein